MRKYRVQATNQSGISYEVEADSSRQARERVLAQLRDQGQRADPFDWEVVPVGMSYEPDIAGPEYLPRKAGKGPQEASGGFGKSGDPRFPRNPEELPLKEPSMRPRDSMYNKGISDRNLKASRRDHQVGQPRSPKDMEEALRSAIRARLPEVVRRKEGGGGWVLYAPNEKGKKRKKNPKPVGEFPTKAAARKAELARFPPKNPTRLKKMRKEIEKLLKDPKRAAAQSSKDARSPKPHAAERPKRAPIQKVESLRKVIGRMVSEELRRQVAEALGSGMWSQLVRQYPSLNELMEGWIQHAETHGAQSAIELANDEISANIPKGAQLQVMAFAAIEISNAAGGK